MPRIVNRTRAILFFLGVLLLFLMGLTVSAASSTPSVHLPIGIDESTSLDMQEDPEDLFTYLIDMADYPAYAKIAENDGFILYSDSTTHNIAVYVKATGYAWFSVDPDYDGTDAQTNRNHNAQTQNRIRSSIYYRTTQLDTISPERYLLNEEHAVTYSTLENGFTMHVELTAADIAFDIEIRLTTEGLVYLVPFDSLVEGELRLQSLRIFPSFGATTGDDVVGYLFIPDGPGALIRYDNPAPGSSYTQDVYGEDMGYLTQTTTTSAFDNILPKQAIRLPVIGGVHGIRKNAYVAIIDSGAEYAQVRSEIRNSVTKYFLNSFSFQFRQLYFRPTDSTGNGFRISPADPAPFDIQVEYRFLSGEDADYVGMAKAYGETIDWQEAVHLDQTPLHLDWIGTEVYTGLLSKRTLAMTSYEAANAMVEDLLSHNIKLHSVSLFGKDLDGSYAFGKRGALGSNREYETLLNTLSQEGIAFQHGAELNYSIAPTSSVAKQLGGVTLRIASDSDVFLHHSLIDSLGWETRLEDLRRIVLADTTGIDFTQTATTSYTHINASRVTVYRHEMTRAMASMIALLQDDGASIALRNPNDYLLPYADSILDVPLGSSGYPFVTDTIPFYQIAVGGHIPLFSTALNFATNRKVYLLKMIEYGIFPSYVLTEKDAFLLRGSDNLSVFTSEYAIWKVTIQSEYAMLSQALDAVVGSSMASHRYLGNQLVRVGYENGTILYLNYDTQDQTVEGRLVPAGSCLVVTGGGA